MNTNEYLDLDITPLLSIVYCYTIYKNDGDLMYVGQVTHNVKNKLKTRHSGHLCGKQYVDKMLRTHKYDLEILWIGYETDADATESYFIKLFSTIHPYGLNLQTGGHKNKHFSEKVLKQMSEKRKGMNLGIKRSEETKIKMSLSQRGKKRSSEFVKKMKESHKHLNKPVIQYDGETGAKVAKYSSISDASKSTSIQPIHISQACRGIVKQAGGFMWRYEVEVRGDEQIEVVRSKFAKKRVCQKTLDGKIIQIYESVSEVYKIKGYSTGQICDCCNGKNKTAKGFRWEYV